jgi:hypothetical protein
MTSIRIKRSDVATYIDTTPTAGSRAYERIGDGVTDATVDYAPNVTSEVYIHEDAATALVEGYAPTMAIEQVAKNGDAVFEFIDALRKAQAILDDAKTTVVEVWLYETPTSNEYPAQKRNASISINSGPGGAGGTAARISYTINYSGDPVNGTFNPTTKAFTPNPNVAEGLSALTIGSLTLTPTFSRDQLFYTTTTDTSPQTGTATAENSAATVLLKNGATTIDTGTGSATGSITLATGENVVTAKVTIGTVSNTYTVTVTKTV